MSGAPFAKDRARAAAWARWRKPELIGPLGELDPLERQARALEASLRATKRWEAEKRTWSREKLAAYEKRKIARDRYRKKLEDKLA